VWMIPHLVSAASWGGEVVRENRALLGGRCRRTQRHYLDKGVAYAVFVYTLVLLRGIPRYGYPGSDDDDALASLYLLRASFLD
jgi:hypothetical protein